MTASTFLGTSRSERTHLRHPLAMRLMDWVGDLSRRAARRRDIEVSICRLREFDDHLLRDLGLHRGDIESRVRG